MNQDTQHICEKYITGVHENKNAEDAIQAYQKNIDALQATGKQDPSTQQTIQNLKNQIQKLQTNQPSVADFFTQKPPAEEPAAPPTEAPISPDPWQQEQERINKTADLPSNWQNASWAKRARTMGRGRSPADIKKLAEKEWERKEAMRKEARTK